MAKGVFNTGHVEIGTTTYNVFNITYNEKYAEVDGTDTGSSGNVKEYYAGRADRTFSFSMFNDLGSADIALNSSDTIELSFAGKTYSGTGIILEKNVEGAIDDMVKTTYSGRFTGAVTVTPVT